MFLNLLIQKLVGNKTKNFFLINTFYSRQLKYSLFIVASDGLYCKETEFHIFFSLIPCCHFGHKRYSNSIIFQSLSRIELGTFRSCSRLHTNVPPCFPKNQVRILRWHFLLLQCHIHVETTFVFSTLHCILVVFVYFLLISPY